MIEENRVTEESERLSRRTVHLALPVLLVSPLALFAAGCLPGTGRTGVAAPGASAGPTVGLAVDAADGSLLKADRGLFRSADGGVNWKELRIPGDLRPDKIRQVATSTAAPSSLYAGGPGAGLLRSDDGGQNWRALSSGLPSQQVAAFAVHSFRPDTLYAWIGGNGIFRTEDGGGRWQKMDDGPPAAVGNLVHSTLEGSMNTGWLYAATPEGVYLSMD
ncbi:MAG: hypothetical protein HY332_17010 [Chloroflexi bacterium]|nr:hypothetical protein [Chloroflexota bacterium]